MKRIPVISFCMVSAILTLTLFSCNSGTSDVTIYKTWNFVSIYPVDTAKASPWAMAAENMLASVLKDFKVQFNSDKTMKVYKGGNFMYSQKFEMPDKNSIKCAMGGDSVELYQVELSDTSLNLVNGGMAMHFNSPK